jgi:hypothetical protein
MRKQSKYYAFTKPPEMLEDGQSADIFEYKAEGEVRKVFLRGGYGAQTVVIKTTDLEIDRMKSIVRTSPEFKEEDYRWPLEGPGLLRFMNKVDLHEDFGQVWDAWGMNNIDDIEARPRLSKENIDEGAIILKI